MAAGDSVGATPPISNFFGDTPTIEFMNMMGFDIDGLGNHNFDRGSAYLRNTLIPLANFPYVSANVRTANGQTLGGWKASRTFTLDGGIKIGFVGFTNDDAPTLVKPGSFDPFVVGNSTGSRERRGGGARLQDQRDRRDRSPRRDRRQPHGTDRPAPRPRRRRSQRGRHRRRPHRSASPDHPKGILVTENRSKSLRFTRIRIVIGDGKDAGVAYKTADFHKPWNIGITPDPAIQARIDDLNAELLPILGQQVGTSSSNVAVPRGDACRAETGRTDGRACESLVGDIVTDAMRQQYNTDFAITNSGGLRADLTCPTVDSTTDFCPASLYPFAAGNFPITRGQILTSCRSATSRRPRTSTASFSRNSWKRPCAAADDGIGRFGQVSGLCVQYNIEGVAKTFQAGNGNLGTGHRVNKVVKQATDGTCDFVNGIVVGLTASDHYTLTINDFMMTGGDGYPNVRTTAATQDILDQDLADYIATLPGNQLTPVIQHRVSCFDPNPGVGANCLASSP